MTNGKAALQHTAYTYHPLRPSMLTLLEEMHGAMHQAEAPIQYARKKFLAKVEVLKPRILEMHAKGLSVPKMAAALELTYSAAYEALQECKRQAGIR